MSCEKASDLYVYDCRLGTCTYMVQNRITGKRGVMTKLRCTPDSTERRVKTEVSVIEALTAAKVGNIPTILDYGVEKEEVFMVTKYIGCDLQTLLSESKHNKLEVAAVTNIGNHVLNILFKMHPLGWVHGDIRPRNILLNIDPPRTCWLVGFYRTQSIVGDTVAKVITNDLVYTSPRVDGGHPLHPVDDLVSLIYTLDYLLRGSLPWAGETDRDAVIKMKHKFKPHDALGPLYKFALTVDKNSYYFVQGRIRALMNAYVLAHQCRG